METKQKLRGFSSVIAASLFLALMVVTSFLYIEGLYIPAACSVLAAITSFAIMVYEVRH